MTLNVNMLRTVSTKPPIAPKAPSIKSPGSALTRVNHAHHVKTTNSQQQRTSAAKTSNQAVAKTPSNKPGSRNGPPPAPQLMVVRYTIDNDVLKCPVCLEVFKSPRVISCGHSFCFDCLNSVILYDNSNKETFPCPVCHKVSKPHDSKAIRQRWVMQFPVNSVIQRLLRNASLRNPNDNGVHKAFCGVCLVNNMTRTVVSYCNNCLEHHCEVCSKYHALRDDAQDHDVTVYVHVDKEMDYEKLDSFAKSDLNRKLRVAKDPGTVSGNGKRVKINSTLRDGNMVPAGNGVVSQTVTAADSMSEKSVVKLGHFNGNAPNDSAISDFRSIVFITNSKVVMADHANKKLKVFDITHKTRVELISELAIRAVPTHMCRVNESTVAVITERIGVYHIRLFTIRDKINHFVHRTIDGVPLGIGAIQNTIVCSFLEDLSLTKYRLTRAQQQKVGSIKHDRSGNDIFHHPGAMCSGLWRGTAALMVADETEFGVTVYIIDAHGERKSSVFFECEFPKPKAVKKSAQGIPKTNRQIKAKSARTLKKDEAVDTTTESEFGTLKETIRKQSKNRLENHSSDNPTERISGRHTFRRVDEYGKVTTERKCGREIERPAMSATLRSELSIDLNKLDTDLNETITKSNTKKPSGADNKAVERALKNTVGKVAPQLSKNGSARTSDRKSNEKPDPTQNPSSTITSNSTIGTVSFSTPPKLVYRADSIAVDNIGYIYVCMSSFNKIHQMSPDGRVKRDLLTDKDGLLAPKCISFSMKNDVLLVTCLKSNKVNMFRLK